MVAGRADIKYGVERSRLSRRGKHSGNATFDDSGTVEAATLLIEQGADVLYTVTGPGYKGVWEAAQKAGVPVVAYAYDSYDIAPDVIAASVTYDGPKQFELVAQMFTDGTIESKLYNVGYEYIGIADFRGSVDAETETTIRDTFEQIASGAIEVPERTLTEQEMAEAFK